MPALEQLSGHALPNVAQALSLLPPAAYDVRYTPANPVIGFAFEAQSGVHAFASDRTTLFRTRPNSLAFTPAGCDVTSRSAAGGEYLLLTLNPDPGRGAMPERAFNNSLHPAAIGAAEALRAMLLRGGGLDSLALEAAIAVLVAAIGSGGPSAEDAAAQRWMTAARLRQIDDLIEAGLEETLTVDALAARLGLSAGFLSRALKAAIGKAPYDHILDRRLARARRHLRERRLALAEIALASGFSSQAHMTTQFRRRLGVTPGALR